MELLELKFGFTKVKYLQENLVKKPIKLLPKEGKE